jgi:hypothetical protein
MVREELVVLLTMKDALNAEIIKSLLQDHEIFCAIEGEHQAGLTGILDIRIFVRERDLAEAREILREHQLQI